MNVLTISPQKLAALRRQGEVPDLIDVRTPVEFREVHVEGARNMPLDQLDPVEMLRSRREADEGPLYLICRSGSRGAAGLREAPGRRLHRRVQRRRRDACL